MSYRRRSTLVDWVIFILGLMIIVTVMGQCAVQNTGTRMASFKVKRVTEVADHGGKYLIFTERGDVYENDDRILHGKFNSSDLQAQMSPGDCYRAKVVGYRFRPLSMYPNVLELYPCK